MTQLQLPWNLNIDSNASKIEKALFSELKKIHPLTVELIQRSIKKVEINAKKDWPIRQAKYGISQNSKDKFYKKLKVSNKEIVASIGNRAEYAWNIFSGFGSSTSVPRGQKVVDHLLYSPLQKEAERISKVIAQKVIGKIIGL